MLDWVASIILLASVALLAYKQRIGWALNFVGTLLFAYIFRARLPILLLELAFAGFAAKGWWSWHRNVGTRSSVGRASDL